MIQDLLESGIRLFYYYTDEEVTLDGAVDKFMIAARSFAAELEREKTAQRTHEHLLTKARRGLVVGGRVYGYDNVERCSSLPSAPLFWTEHAEQDFAIIVRRRTSGRHGLIDA